MKIAIVGAGNVATHLSKELKRVNVDVVSIWSNRFVNAEKLANEVGGYAASDLKQLIVEDSDIIIIAVKDDVIKAVADQLKGYKGIIVHTSGAVGLNEVASVENYGVFYPLQTFSKAKEINFKNVPLCLEANTAATLLKLKELAGLLSKNIYEVNTRQRETLHLAAVFACNFPNYLYTIAQQLLEKQQLNFELIKPLIEETANKVQTALPATVQTGPAVRNDEQTLLKHKGLLKENPDWLNIYSILSANIASSS